MRHIHRFSGVARINRNHRHRFEDSNGVNLRSTSGGRHFHRGSGLSTRDFAHRHRYAFSTGRNLQV